MVSLTAIKEHAEVIGADGVHVGTVDRGEGDRIKLTKADSGQGSHKGHHHYVSHALVAASKAARSASPPMRMSPSPSKKSNRRTLICHPRRKPE